MDQFSNRIAVVTGGGTGMGRELVRQLSAEGCHVAMCDISAETMAETAELAGKEAPEGTRVLTFAADVSNEDQLIAFRDHIVAELETDHINLLFNNAGIGGAGSFVADTRAAWERTFNVCWGGVYLGCRTFLPLLVAADEGHVVNTSSVNGLWASIGPNVPHTAYSAAKFAVRGFTEALMTDLGVHAPHVHAHVVHPGHIGTDIVKNSALVHGNHPEHMTGAELDDIRRNVGRNGIDLSGVSDDDLRGFIAQRAEAFRDGAPTTAEEAATVILDGVRSGQWRILVGDDAHILDELVRADPHNAYTPEFFESMVSSGGLNMASPSS